MRRFACATVVLPVLTVLAMADTNDDHYPLCYVGMTLERGDACYYDDAEGDRLLFVVTDDGFGCITGPGLQWCAGTGHISNDLDIREDDAGNLWTIYALPNDPGPPDESADETVVTSTSWAALKRMHGPP